MVAVANVKDLAQEARGHMTVPSETPEVEKCNLKKEKLIRHHYFTQSRHPRSKNVKMVDAVKLFMGIKLPAKFLQILSEENFLDAPRANIWIIEYKKFLAL